MTSEIVNLLEVTGVTAIMMTFCGWGVHLLIKQYFKKKEEFEAQLAENQKLRDKEAARSLHELLDRYERDINNLGKMTRSMRDDLVVSKEEMRKNQSALASVTVDVKSLTKVIKIAIDTAESISNSMSEEIETQVKVQVAKLNERIKILSENNGMGME